MLCNETIKKASIGGNKMIVPIAFLLGMMISRSVLIVTIELSKINGKVSKKLTAVGGMSIIALIVCLIGFILAMCKAIYEY